MLGDDLMATESFKRKLTAIVSYRLTERYNEALRMTKEMLSRWPDNIPGHVHLVWIYMGPGA